MSRVDPLALLRRHYPAGHPATEILLDHSRRVADKALAVATALQELEPIDLDFVVEAALLHDIGIKYVQAPAIGCHGDQPYLAHGLLGRQLLETEGLPRHALVCERHIGVGLSGAEIAAQGLPLPVRDMIPLELEEIVITYADLFFSKTPGHVAVEKSVAEVRRSLARYGAVKVAIFDDWQRRFAG